MEDQLNCTFRKIAKAEFDRLHDLFPDDEPLWQKYRDMRLKELDQKEIDIYVIERGDVVIGELSASYVSHTLPTEAIPGRRAYLQAFRVEKEYQGVGLGQRLLQFTLSDLERRGYTEFTIGVGEENELAMHIYFKFGFTEAIDQGRGDKFDPTDYTLYMRSTRKEN